MPTLRTVPGQLVTLSPDGPRRMRPEADPLRDLELGGADTLDIYLDTPPLTTLLATLSARYAKPFMDSLHAALDTAEAAQIVDVAAILEEVKKA